MKPKPLDGVWFRSLHFGSPHAVLWWLVFPDRACHIAAELMLPKGVISTLCQEMRQQTRALRLALEQVRYTVATKSSMIGTMSAEEVGETRAQTFRANQIPIRAISYDPLQGWTRIQELLGHRPDGRPWLTISPQCPQLIRAITTAVSDPANAEDVLASAIQPALLALCVGAMSRPAPKPFAKPALPKHAVGHLVEAIRGGEPRSSLAWR